MSSLPAEDKLLNALESGDFITALPLLPKDGPLITIGPVGFTPLHYACRHGEAEATRLLITQYHYSIKSTSICGQTPAHVAAKYGHVNALKALVDCSRDSECGSDTDICTSATNAQTDYSTKEGNTPLHTAFQCSPACTNLLQTPLHLAAQNGYLHVIKYLVDEVGYPLSPENEHGETPLYTAAKHGQLEVVKYFIDQKNCDLNVHTNKPWELKLSKGHSVSFIQGKNPLYAASQDGHLNIVHYLVNEVKCDPSCRDEDGVTPLHLASQQGHLAIVKFLVIECQCDPNVARYDGRTLLHTTCMWGNLDIVQFLIENTCDPEVKDQWGGTPLHYASGGGHLETVQYLINEHHVDPSCQDENKDTPLHLASQNGHMAVVHFLTEKGCDPVARNEDGDTPVSIAVLGGRLDVLKFFITKNGCDPMVRGWRNRTPVHNAGQKGHLKTVQYLVNEHQVDPSCQDDDGETPLHLASMCGHLPVVRFLTDQGCDPLARNKDGDTPVHYAQAFNRRLDVLKFFITDRGYDPMVRGQRNRTLVHSASQNGHLKAVQYLIDERRIDPSCQDENGDTPLHLTSICGHLAVVRFLTEKGCDPLAKNKNDNTSVSLASLNGRLDVLKFFITEKGCDPMIRDQFNRTLVHHASDRGHLDSVQYLVNEHQVDPSCQDENGWTPLHLASMNGHLSVVHFLTETCCDPLAKNKNGDSPVHYAALNGRLDVLMFFITEKGFDPIVRGRRNRTLVHLASDGGHLKTVKYLINEHQVDPSCWDKNSWTPLHLASRNGHLAVVRFLTEKGCDPLAKNRNDNTSVSLASLNGRLDVLKFFITEKGCDPMMRDQFNRTLVHHASDRGHIDSVQYLVNEHQVDPSCQDENGWTPLHLASRNGHLAVVHFLTEKNCDPLAKNKKSNTPIHYATLNGKLDVLKFFITEKGCDPMVRGQWKRSLVHYASNGGHLETVQYLINEHQVDPSCQDENGATPLHMASEKGHLAVVHFFAEKGCDPLAQNIQGDTPVHYAAYYGRLDILKFFITEKGCDPIVRGNGNNTPLHYASQEGHLETVQYLINEHQVDPLSHRSKNWTAFHLAVRCGHIEIVKFLIEKANCDPFEPLSFNPFFTVTPMSLAVKHNHDNIVTYLHSKGVLIPKGFSITKPHLDLHVSIYCIGNQSVGKSTLVKALSTEGAFEKLRRVRDVPPETAGIVPLVFFSYIYGKVTFYDFAGHKEYYASHEVVFEKNSHPVILLTVDVSEDDETICSNLQFWRHFLVNVLSASTCQAYVIIVGSHADLVSSRLQEKRSLLLKIFESTHSLNAMDCVLLDCRRPSSSGMSKLREVLKETSKRVRIESQFDYHNGGILNRFIENYLTKVTVLTFLELHSTVMDTAEAYLKPLQSYYVLYQTCESLSISGHILMLGDRKVPEESWVILQKKVILSQVHGLLKHMKQSTDLELGIFPLSLIESLLQKHAQDLSPDLAIRYMKKMVFCSEIDPQALAHIKSLPHESIHANERYFFFSSLVSVEKPSEVNEWNLDQSQTYASGWYLKCANPDHFLTPRFLQELLIELACQFALKIGESSPVQIEPKKGCIIWKNGIRWLDRRGIEVVAEVGNDSKSLRLVLKSLPVAKMECTNLRSTLIKEILRIKQKLCGEMELDEYFIHPIYFTPPFCKSEINPPDHVLIPVSEMANTTLHHSHQLVVDQRPRNVPFLSVEELLHFEPYHHIGADLVLALYSPQNEHKVIEDPALEKLAEAFRAHWEHIAIALNVSLSTIEELRINDRVTTIKKCLEVFREWSGGMGTYYALRHDLDQYSIFRGRSILDACSDHEQQLIQHSLEALKTEEQRKKPAVECPTATDPHQPSPPPAHNRRTDSGNDRLVELTDASPLGMESLLEVRTEVVSVVGHSTDLGLALGLRQEPTIHVLQKENQQDIARQFTEIIAAWLRGVDQAGTPSWRSLTKALIVPTVDCPLIARRIAERHPSGNSKESPVRETDLQFMDVDASSLDENSVDVLAESLIQRSHLWFHLGLVFGLSYGRLKAIQIDTISSKERLMKTLHSWLCLRDQVLQQGQPSWRTLVRALTHPLVDEMRLAEELAETHKVHAGESGDTTSPVALSSSDPSHPPPSHSTST